MVTPLEQAMRLLKAPPQMVIDEDQYNQLGSSMRVGNLNQLLVPDPAINLDDVNEMGFRQEGPRGGYSKKPYLDMTVDRPLQPQTLAGVRDSGFTALTSKLENDRRRYMVRPKWKPHQTGQSIRDMTSGEYGDYVPEPEYIRPTEEELSLMLGETKPPSQLPHIPKRQQTARQKIATTMPELTEEQKQANWQRHIIAQRQKVADKQNRPRKRYRKGEPMDLAMRLLKMKMEGEKGPTTVQQRLPLDIPFSPPSEGRRKNRLTPQQMSELKLTRKPLLSYHPEDPPTGWEYAIHHPNMKPFSDKRTTLRNPHTKHALSAAETNRGKISQTTQSQTPASYRGQGLYGKLLASMVAAEHGLDSSSTRSGSADRAHQRFTDTTGLVPEKRYGTGPSHMGPDYRYTQPRRRPEWGGLRSTIAGQMPIHTYNPPPEPLSTNVQSPQTHLVEDWGFTLPPKDWEAQMSGWGLPTDLSEDEKRWINNAPA